MTIGNCTECQTELDMDDLRHGLCVVCSDKFHSSELASNEELREWAKWRDAIDQIADSSGQPWMSRDE